MTYYLVCGVGKDGKDEVRKGLSFAEAEEVYKEFLMKGHKLVHIFSQRGYARNMLSAVCSEALRGEDKKHIHPSFVYKLVREVRDAMDKSYASFIGHEDMVDITSAVIIDALGEGQEDESSDADGDEGIEVADDGDFCTLNISGSKEIVMTVLDRLANKEEED